MSSPEGQPKKHNSALWQWIGALSVPVVIIVGVLLITPFLDQNVRDVELTYNVKVAEAPSSFLNREITVVDRNGDRLKCQMPSRGDVKSKAPMECNNSVRIEARNPD